MKVAVVSDYAALSGGITVFLENVMRFLACDVTFILIAWSEPPLEMLSRPRDESPPYQSITLVEDGDVVSAASAIEECDIVFLQTSWNVRLLAVMASALCRSSGTPLLTVLHTTSHSSPDAVSRCAQEGWLAEILRQSSHVVCVSDAVRWSVAHLVEPVKLSVIENASRFRLTDRAGRSVPSDQKAITYVGRAASAKGAEDFFRVAEELEDTDLTFVCNGLYPDIERHAGRAPANVKICHSLGEQEMLSLYCRSHAMVATYRRSEGLPLALLEALSLGIPVLGYESPGVTDLLVRHDQFLVDVGNSSAIAGRIRSWWAGESDLTYPKPEIVPHWREAAGHYGKLLQEMVS